MPVMPRNAEAAGESGRTLGYDRRRRAEVPGRRSRAAEVRVRLRWRGRDGARSGPCRRRWPLLAALRDQGRLRQVRRAPAPGIVYHRICDDKSARTFKDLLGDYRGWVVADALGSHEGGARECRGLKLAACWAHVLRRFRDAVVDFSEAQFMLAWIQDLYAIDGRATDARERARRSRAQ